MSSASERVCECVSVNVDMCVRVIGVCVRVRYVCVRVRVNVGMCV